MSTSSCTGAPPIWRAALVAVIILIPDIANADTPLPTSVVTNDSPVTLSHCYVGLKDTSVGNVNYYLQAAVAFTNSAKLMARAIQFKFSEYDVFGSLLSEVTGNDEGTFSPGIDIEPRTAGLTGQVQPQWEWINTASAVHSVTCGVTRVLFTDGSQWIAR